MSQPDGALIQTGEGCMPSLSQGLEDTRGGNGRDILPQVPRILAEEAGSIQAGPQSLFELPPEIVENLIPRAGPDGALKLL
jgi:hypothetical protein